MAQRFHLSSVRGITYSFAFGLFTAVNLTAAKAMLMKDFDPFLLIFFRSSVHLAAFVKFPSWTAACVRYNSRDLFYYLSGTFVGVLSWLAINLSSRRLEVGDNTAIEMGSIVLFTASFGYLLVREEVDRYEIAILSCDVVGIFLVSQPSAIFGQGANKQKGDEFVGVIFAITSGFLFSVYTICVKIITKRDVFDAGLVQFFHAIVGIPFAILSACFVSPWKVKFDVSDCLLVVTYQGACLGQTAFQALALETENAKDVAVSSTIACVFTYLAQLTIFRASVDWVAIIGSICILSVIILLQMKQLIRDNLKGLC